MLQPFEGIAVLSSGVVMPGASGGLNKALVVDDLELHKGEEVTIAVQCKVKELRFPPVKDTDGVQRVHVLTVENAAVIDRDTVDAALDAQREKVEAAAGIQRLPYGDGDPGDAYTDPDQPDDPGD